MTEHDCKKYLKEFAMWARLPVPKVTFGDVTSVQPENICLCMEDLGNEKEQADGLQYLAAAWLICMGSDARYSAKVTDIITTTLFGGLSEPS